MKTHALVNYLELVVKILRQMPNDDLGEGLAWLLDAARRAKSSLPGRQGTAVERADIPDELVEQIQKMSPVELERFLDASTDFKATNRLRALAGKLGVPLSRRQGAAAIANAIVRHLESKKMDYIIRGRHPTDKPNR